METSDNTKRPPLSIVGPGGIAYELDDSLRALHGTGALPGADADAGPSVRLGHDITIVRAVPSPTCAARTGPVYRAGAHGAITAPTGRVFVRFREGVHADRKGPELAEAGFRLESVPGYAPHAAWVRAANGGVVDALVELGQLHRVADVEHVEPQLVSEAASRN